MHWLKAITAEIFGLFVDDGAFSLAIIVWLATCWLVMPWLNLSRAWSGFILFTGLALILVESATRRSRR